MTISQGTRLGPYEVLALLGAGGMGEVYRARDTKLNREVAIKVLPAAFALDANRLARFTREAQVLASLNHPNIAGIYGIEDNAPLDSAGGAVSGSRTAIVMELVEGQDLSEMIFGAPVLQTTGTFAGVKAHALHLSEAIAIARQIAEALEAAHDQGIVHRDLKPQNIKVRADGTVKVLDFGIAKAIDVGRGVSYAGTGAAEGTPYDSPTVTSSAMTAMGVVLGTAAYMSPEQAKGKAVDKRADIWAFGVVLYEMLTGRPAFEGDDMSDLLVAVLSKDVDLGALPVDTPASIVALIRRCLTRDPKLRLRDIGEARVTLANPGPPGAAVVREAPRVPVGLNGMTAAIVIATAALTALGFIYLRPATTPSDSRAVFLPFAAPDAVVSEAGYATISPDGRMVAFAGRG